MTKIFLWLASAALLAVIAAEGVLIAKTYGAAKSANMEARYAELQKEADAEAAKFEADIQAAQAEYAKIKEKGDADLASAKAKIAQAQAPYQARLSKARAAVADAQATLDAYNAEVNETTTPAGEPE